MSNRAHGKRSEAYIPDLVVSFQSEPVGDTLVLVLLFGEDLLEVGSLVGRLKRVFPMKNEKNKEVLCNGMKKIPFRR